MTNRFKSPVERNARKAPAKQHEVSSQNKRKRVVQQTSFCSVCRGSGHNRTTCPINPDAGKNKRSVSIISHAYQYEARANLIGGKSLAGFSSAPAAGSPPPDAATSRGLSSPDAAARRRISSPRRCRPPPDLLPPTAAARIRRLGAPPTASSARLGPIPRRPSTHRRPPLVRPTLHRQTPAAAAEFDLIIVQWEKLTRGYLKSVCGSEM
ncbi:hypothetical protein BRADI_3g58234v3 [Brachypodium distachyon]|uniref:Uncharacterized protein n=1 Tax=Brachypodium distachyon TaxID=15368 RepID=A0A2K2D5P1_BRADI|nr:hypothetical protein BRADI_3g58234v3 [Brachypodium distachyon]